MEAKKVQIELTWATRYNGWSAEVDGKTETELGEFLESKLPDLTVQFHDEDGEFDWDQYDEPDAVVPTKKINDLIKQKVKEYDLKILFDNQSS